MVDDPIRVVWKGRVAYGEALAAQRAHRDGLLAGRGNEELWLLEHDPVITTGRRAVDDLDPARIRAAGYALHRTERGGLATCHEPGQIVGYLLCDARRLGIRRTVHAVEEGLIRWLGVVGVPAARRCGYPGAWVGADKICAVGLHVRGGFTMHGFALNLVNDLRGFSLITPCGIRDGGISSVARLVAGAPTPVEAATPPREGLGAFVVRALLDARMGME